MQWRIWLSDFGINDSNILSPNDWTSASLPAFTDAYKGDGVDVTLVREGSAFYVFASEHGKPDTAKLALQYPVSAGYAETLGNWAFGGSDITANAKFEFEAGTDKEDVDYWMSKIRATIIDETEETEHGTLEISSSVITIKPEAGYILETITVDNVDRMSDVDKDTSTLVLKTSAGETYRVKATFKEDVPPVSVSITVTASNVNDQSVVIGKTLVLENTWYRYKYTIGAEGAVAASVAPGTYTATILESGTFEASGDVTVSANTPVTINFAYTAFTANLIFGTNTSGEPSGPIDISKPNDTSGSVKNLEEGRMWAVKNDTNGSSAFTVTVQKSDINENLLLAFIIDGKVVVLQVKTSNSGNFYVEWRDWMADLGVDNIISPTGWPAGTESAASNA